MSLYVKLKQCENAHIHSAAPRHAQVRVQTLHQIRSECENQISISVIIFLYRETYLSVHYKVCVVSAVL